MADGGGNGEGVERRDEKVTRLEDGEMALEDARKAVDQARCYLKVCTERRGAARHKIEIRPETSEE